MIPLRDANPTDRLPVLTGLLILINVALFVHSWQDGLEAFQGAIHDFALVPAEWIQSGFRVEPVLTYMFMHASWLHLIGNMWYLWIFSDNVEDRLGSLRYASLYFLSGLGAVILHVISAPQSMVPIVGASGAISGVLGAYSVFFPNARLLVFWPFFFFSKTSAKFFIGIWFVIQFLSGGFQSLANTTDVGGIAYWAHVGGFAVGWLLGHLWKGRLRSTQANYL